MPVANITETVSLTEAGRRLGVPTAEVIRLIDRGELDAVRIDGRLAVPVSALR